MKITGIRKFNTLSAEERAELNERLVKSNLTLSIVGKKLAKSSSIIYTASIVVTSISTLLALISDNKELQNESYNLYQRTRILNDMVDSLKDENQAVTEKNRKL